jgi:hypothetical protein
MPIPDPVMVICVDGPTRGRLRAVTGGQKTRFQVYDVSVQPLPDPDGEDITLPTLDYHVHQIHLLGFTTRIASIQINQDNIDPYDVISCLFSEAGRQATYRVNGE